jgi:hypothetical protein
MKWLVFLSLLAFSSCACANAQMTRRRAEYDNRSVRPNSSTTNREIRADETRRAPSLLERPRLHQAEQPRSSRGAFGQGTSYPTGSVQRSSNRAPFGQGSSNYSDFGQSRRPNPPVSNRTVSERYTSRATNDLTANIQPNRVSRGYRQEVYTSPPNSRDHSNYSQPFGYNPDDQRNTGNYAYGVRNYQSSSWNGDVERRRREMARKRSFSQATLSVQLSYSQRTRGYYNQDNVWCPQVDNRYQYPSTSYGYRNDPGYSSDPNYYPPNEGDQYSYSQPSFSAGGFEQGSYPEGADYNFSDSSSGTYQDSYDPYQHLLYRQAADRRDFRDRVRRDIDQLNRNNSNSMYEFSRQHGSNSGSWGEETTLTYNQMKDDYGYKLRQIKRNANRNYSALIRQQRTELERR